MLVVEENTPVNGSHRIQENDESSPPEALAKAFAVNHNRLASKKINQTLLFAQIGKILGTEFRRILDHNNVSVGRTSFFGCPLDEALVLVNLVSSQRPQDNNNQPGDGLGDSLLEYNLAPYGSYPALRGRSHLGQMELLPLQTFWSNVAESAQLTIRMQKIRGDNAHHIVEASFKAFSRALRNLIDGINTVENGITETIRTTKLDELYGATSANVQASVDLQRMGKVSRKTKETNIEAQLWLDQGKIGVQVSMGLALLDQFWTTVSHEAQVSLQVACQGDLWIDEHHTAEDVAIALGQVWNQALGNKAGLNRMWCARVVQGTACVMVILDLSNRPMLCHNLPLAQHPDDHLIDVPIEMLEHVLDSFVVNARMTLQIYVQSTNTKDENGGDNDKTTTTRLEDAWKGLAMALGRALRYCILVDSRRAGATASSKGTLSV